MTFRALRDACDGISPTVLNARLAELKETEIVETTADGYALTTIGRKLGTALAPLSKWAEEWARQLGG